MGNAGILKWCTATTQTHQVLIGHLLVHQQPLKTGCMTHCVIIDSNAFLRDL